MSCDQALDLDKHSDRMHFVFCGQGAGLDKNSTVLYHSAPASNSAYTPYNLVSLSSLKVLPLVPSLWMSEGGLLEEPVVWVGFQCQGLEGVYMDMKPNKCGLGHVSLSAGAWWVESGHH